MTIPLRLCVSCLIFSLVAIPAFAQEETPELVLPKKPLYKMSIAIGPEWNMNSYEYFAGGIALGFDYNLPEPFAIGLGFSANTNFSGTNVFEPTAMFRWYFLGVNHSGLFAQADLGASLVQVPYQKEVVPMFLGGVRLGCRFSLGKFYVEPFGRGGYPFAFGFGVVAGIKLMEEKQWDANDTLFLLRR